ncbi:hypothetical protein HEP84_55310 [Streptomyces sp. RLB1-33]|nr:hypothetical protein [Streptomyces sp. RLB1-33]
MSSRYVSGRGWIRTNISERGEASTPCASGEGSYCPAVDDV